MKKLSQKRLTPSKGFTLIELLVVISIIALLSSIILAALNTARNKAYDARRFSDLNQVNIALQSYYADHGSYPSTIGTHYYSYCSGSPFNNNNPENGVANGTIPNLAPTYIPVVPVGPQQQPSASNAVDCYAYISNGTDFKFDDYNPQGAGGSTPNASSHFDDPAAPNVAWAVYSSYTFAANN